MLGQTRVGFMPPTSPFPKLEQGSAFLLGLCGDGARSAALQSSPWLQPLSTDASLWLWAISLARLSGAAFG